MNRKMHFGARSRSYGLLVAMGWVFLTGVSALAAEDAVPAYKNRNLPVDERVKDLIGRMWLNRCFRATRVRSACYLRCPPVGVMARSRVCALAADLK